MDAFITTFHIDWKIMLAQIVNFGIVFGVIYFFAMKPLKKLMNDRSNKIAIGLEDAKTNAALVEKTKKEYEKVLAEARAEANEISKQAKIDAENNRKETVKKTGAEVAQMIANGKKNLEAEKIKIVEEARGEIVALVVGATEKLLESHVDEDFDEKAIKQIKKM